MDRSPDVIIIGSGSTAFAAALRASSHGASIVMIEKSMLGGTCINWGCIPSKTLIHAALFNHEAGLGARIGLAKRSGAVDFSVLAGHKDDVVRHLRTTRYLEVLQQIPDLELVKGTARFVDRRTVVVENRQFSSDRILIAVGGNPRIPEIPGLSGSAFLTSRSALLLKELPKSLVIIGGGVIAVELGQMFHRLGVRVTILEHGPRLLPAVSPAVALALQEVLVAEGVRIVTDAAFCSVSSVGDLTVVSADLHGRRHEFTGERLLVAVGTAPATARIGLEEIGMALDRHGFVTVDSTMRSSVPGIWAAGDAIGGMMIASAGAREGIVAVDDMFNPDCGCTMDYLTVPMAIFTDPEICLVGHTAESAHQAGIDAVTNSLSVSAIPKAHVTGHTAGIITMVADRASGRLIGVHLACHRGAELINEAALAIRLRATVEDLASTLHVYPSIGEGLRLCAQGFSRDVSKLSCCAE